MINGSFTRLVVASLNENVSDHINQLQKVYYCHLSGYYQIFNNGSYLKRYKLFCL